MCHFYGHRLVGRPRAGINWLGEVQSLSGDVSHALNISGIFTAAADQQPARRVSARLQPAASEVGNPTTGQEEADSQGGRARGQLLNNVWQWRLQCKQANYVGAPGAVCPWQWNCIRAQPRALAPYLSSLPSLSARLIMSARSGKLFALHQRLQEHTFGFVPFSQQRCEHCGESLANANLACVHSAVDCPGLWPKLDRFFDLVREMGSSGAAMAEKLESVLGVDLITEILTADKASIPKELTGAYWSAVADLLSCSSADDEDMSGQDGVSQDTTGTLASGIDVSSNSQVALGDAYVHVDAVVL